MAFTHARHSVAQNGASSSATCAVTLSSVVASGSLVFVSVGWASIAGDTITQIKDDKNNTYTLVDLVRHVAEGYSWQTARLDGVSNGPITITATISIARTFASILVGEYTGGATGSSIDGHNINVQTGTGTAANAITSGSFVPGTNNDLIYGSCVDIVSWGTVSAGTGYTLRANNLGSSFNSEDKSL